MLLRKHYFALDNPLFRVVLAESEAVAHLTLFDVCVICVAGDYSSGLLESPEYRLTQGNMISLLTSASYHFFIECPLQYIYPFWVI